MFCKSNSIRCPQNLLDKIHVRPEPLRRILVTKLTVPGICRKKNCNKFPIPPSSRLHSYEPLLDPNLKKFFGRRNGVNLNCARRNGCVTEKNELICSVKEFNEFRHDLHRFLRDKQREMEKLETIEEIDAKRLGMSEKVFSKIDEKEKRHHKIYSGMINNPCKHESVVDIIQRRKKKIQDEKRSKAIYNLERYSQRARQIQELSQLRNAQMKELWDQKNSQRMRKFCQVKEAEEMRRMKIMKKIQTRQDDEHERPKRIDCIAKCSIKV